MSNAINFNSAENLRLREVLVELSLVRTQAIADKRPVNTAIRLRCTIIQMAKDGGLIHDMLEQIRRKQLCDHELTKCITTYNKLVCGEIEMIRDGEVMAVKGDLTPIE